VDYLQQVENLLLLVEFFRKFWSIKAPSGFRPLLPIFMYSFFADSVLPLKHIPWITAL
jgi:uncharacterized membrane protein YjjP (DUF1212 family)